MSDVMEEIKGSKEQSAKENQQRLEQDLVMDVSNIKNQQLHGTYTEI